MQPWLAQPTLNVSELLSAGLSLGQIQAFSDDIELLSEDTVLCPTHVVWPMGFSWSSAVVQDTTVATCLQAGIGESSILCPDHDLPVSQQELSNQPPLAEASAARLCQALCKTLDVLRVGVASPRGLHGLLGGWEWFALLQRGFYSSIYSDICNFVQRFPERCRTEVPAGVLNELWATLLLSPLLAAGLDRFPLDTLVATDACPEYGFGVSVSPCAPEDAAMVCARAERRGDYVRLATLPGDPVELARQGKPRRLELAQRDFATVVSARARRSACAGFLAVHGYVLGLKWAARSRKRHHQKVAFLMQKLSWGQLQKDAAPPMPS